MKQAFMTVLLYTIAVNLIGALVATVFSLIYLLFSIIDFLLASLSTMLFITGLIKALSLLGLTYLLVKGLGMMAVAGSSMMMKAFSGVKSLTSGLAGGLNQIDTSSTKDSFKKVANNIRDLDGRKVSNMGRTLGRMGFRKAGNTVRRAGNTLSSVDELKKISRKDNDGKDVSMTKKDDKRGVFPETLLKDSKQEKDKDSEKVNKDKESDTSVQSAGINVIHQAANIGQTGFNETGEDGAIIPYVVAENLMLANGLDSDDVVESVKSYNGDVREHLEKDADELGRKDAIANDAAEELRSNNPEYFSAARELPGGESLNSSMNVSRTDEENSQFINQASNGRDSNAIVDEEKQARYASDTNGIVDGEVAKEFAQNAQDRLNTVAGGMAGMASGSTDKSAINAAEELETANNSEHYTDTLHRNPIHGKVASKDLTDAEGTVDDQDVLLADPEAALRYKNNMKSGDIIDLKENADGVFTAEEYEAASNLQPLAQPTSVTQQADGVSQQGGITSVQNVTQVNNFGDSSDDKVSNSDLLNAMEDGVASRNKQADTAAIAAAMSSSVAASSYFKDSDRKMEFSDETINRLENMMTKTNDQDRVRDRRDMQRLLDDNAKRNSNNSTLASEKQENNNTTNNTNNINTSINNTVNSAASDIKNSNPDISDQDLDSIRSELNDTLSQAVNLNNRRKIEEEREREIANGLERMNDNKNNGKA